MLLTMKAMGTSHGAERFVAAVFLLTAVRSSGEFESYMKLGIHKCVGTSQDVSRQVAGFMD